MTEGTAPRSCDDWKKSAEGFLVDGGSEAEHSELLNHLASCCVCRESVRPYLEVDDTLQQAFKALESGLGAPSPECVDEILRRTRAAPEASRVLKRIRRSVNSLLWTSILLLSGAGLAAIAWLLYRVLVKKGVF